MSSFEQRQLQEVFKKFLKQVLTSKPITSLEKLINLCQNLVKAHIGTIKHLRTNVVEVDLTFHLLKHLFLEDVLSNSFIRVMILNNQITTLQDFEQLAKIQFTDKFTSLIEKYQA